MQGIYRTILKHSGIYGLGQVLSRLSSLLLLPLYTAYLSPADYGCIAILDLTTGVLGLLIGRGISSAVSRYHFEAQNERERDHIWWTGLTFLVCTATACIAPAYLGRHGLALVTLGPTLPQGGYYLALVLGALWCSVVGEVPNVYLRVRQWSGVYVSLSFGSLLVNIALNVYFLTVAGMGVPGVLLGNLLTGILRLTALLLIFAYTRGTYAVQLPLLRKFWQFGGPIIATGLLSIVMHQADRYLLRLFLGLDQVGLYALAYTMGQAVNTLYLLPFEEIWNVTIYDIAKSPEARQVYAEVFEYFVYGLFLLMFAVSLGAQPLLRLVAAPGYGAAASLVPIVCLAYIFFSLHGHFRVPALLAKQTTALLPGAFLAAISNLAGNFLLIPWLGVAGAAWSSVFTFVVFSFVGLWRYRRIDRYPYPLARCGAVLLGLIVSYGACQALSALQLPGAWIVGLTAAVWCVWAVVLLGPVARRLLTEYRDGGLGKTIQASKLVQS